MPTTSLITTIAVLVFLAAFTIAGFKRGLLRILFTAGFAIVIIVLCAFLTRPLASFLREKTFIGAEAESRITEFITEKAEEKEAGIVIGAEDEVVDSLPLPGFLRTDIKVNNTIKKYTEMGVNSFSGYLSERITRIVIYAIAFILLFIVLSIVFRVVNFLLKIIEKIPLIHGINRLFGAVLGLAEGLLILWCICIFIMVFSGTAFGASCMEIISASPILSFIYNHNIIVMAFSCFFYSQTPVSIL